MKRTKIAVYGTLRSEEPNSRYAPHAVRKPCTITGTLYNTGWGFPAFVPEGDTEVIAELIEVTEQEWQAIDCLEGYPRFYDRQVMPVALEDGTTEEAWVYIMNELPEDAKVISSGDWKRR
jgi:gamma-glutamylcyclotransferase (GGCT)/AIG2-like uncharacterized protein YtfP